MNTYMFFTMEGSTEAPNAEKVENVQFVGKANGNNVSTALETLLHENSWILENDFKKEEIYAEQTFCETLRNKIKILVDYLWEDEKKHYEEDEAENHIFLILQELKNAIE